MVIEELRASLLPDGIRYDLDKVQTSPRDTLPEVMARIDELQREIDALTDQKAQAIKEIEAMLEDLPDPDAEVLARYYIRCQSIRRIAREMHYTRDWIYKIIRRN